MSPALTVLLMLAGLLVGVLGTLVGTGGGWALVPLLLFGLGLPPRQAAATSLTVVFLNALSGSVAYLRMGRVRVGMALLFSAATIPGSLVGTQVSALLDPQTFTRAFAAFLLVVAVSLLGGAGRSGAQHDHELEYVASRTTLVVGTLLSAVVGVLSSILGVGGGIIHVPFLILVAGMPPHLATATSHLTLAVTSLTGCVAYALDAQVVWGVALALGAGVVAGAPLGARLSSRLPASAIRRVLGVAVVVFAAVLLVRSL